MSAVLKAESCESSMLCLPWMQPRALSSPAFYKSSVSTGSLLYACLWGSLSSFNIGMQVHKQKEVKRTRNTSASRDYLSLHGTFGHRECPVAPEMHQHRGEQPDSSSSSAGTTFRVRDLCGSARNSVQPWAPRWPAWVTNQFLWFPASHPGPQPAPMAQNLLSHLLPWPPSLSAAISRAAQGEVAACPLFLISCGQVTIYSHSFEDFALP